MEKSLSDAKVLIQNITSVSIEQMAVAQIAVALFNKRIEIYDIKG